MSATVIDCFKNIVTTSDVDKEINPCQVFEEAPAFTLDQLVFHCTSMASQSGLSEEEMSKIISNVRRSNSE